MYLRKNVASELKAVVDVLDPPPPYSP